MIEIAQHWITTFTRRNARVLLLMALILGGGCASTTTQIIPTDRPTITPTATVTPSSTPDANATATLVPSATPVTPTSGPSPTSLFGPSRTPNPDEPTPTRTLAPDAARIEFFTTDEDSIPPGGTINLFWATRNVSRAVIYRLDRGGARLEAINVGPDGRYAYNTSSRDRGQIDFVLIAGEDEEEVQQRLSVPLQCPILWFFAPPPDACPDTEPQSTLIIQQTMQRGRMVYTGDNNQVYALFNDTLTPAWLSFSNQYNPEIHPESLDNFPTAPGQFQPIARLGFVWRGNDTVRNRLGVGIEPEITFDGFVQSAELLGGGTALYISSADGTVMSLLPRGNAWQIITVLPNAVTVPPGALDLPLDTPLPPDSESPDASAP